MKHVWINKRTEKGVKPVREWIECKTCGVHRTNDEGASLPDDDVCEKKASRTV